MGNGRQPGGVKLFGAGRIVVWRGGSMWIGQPEEETDFHAHHAIQITLTLSGGTVRFRRPGQEWIGYKAAITAAHQSHAFEARGELVALIFAEPESREGRVLRERYPEGIQSLAPETFAPEAAALVADWQAGASEEALATRARAITASLSGSEAPPSTPLDKRIARAIDVVRERLGETITMAEVAESVHLSAERFRHLFLQETGIRFRPYILWLRLEIAIAAHASGQNLTEASHAGGFADSAHFSRTFKRMFGVPAVGVQRQGVR
ncbi:MAG: AraC family transcriptional regulator [Herminiimonas sp.]|nr:AraC family transcriptional regulator [Herminiimonas sp.]